MKSCASTLTSRWCLAKSTSAGSFKKPRARSVLRGVGLFLSTWEDWLRPQVREVGPSLIVFEAPILAGQTQIATTRKLQGMAGVTEMVAHRAGIECAEVATSQVKKALTGSGKADKAQMIAAAKAYGFDPKTSDEADAFGIWICAVRLRHPSHAWRWEPLTAARTA